MGKVVTHTFNVGDANFIVSHANGVLLIADAGIGRGQGRDGAYKYPRYPWTLPFNPASQAIKPGMASAIQEGSSSGMIKEKKFLEEPGLGLKAFRNILQNNEINTVHTFITHQHSDHLKLLPDLFKIICQENAQRDLGLSAGVLRPIKIGEFYIGGNRTSDTSIDKGLQNVSKEVGNITATFIGNTSIGNTFEKRGPISSQKFDYIVDQNYNSKGKKNVSVSVNEHTPAKSFHDSFPLRFGNNTDSPVFSVLFPESFDPAKCNSRSYITNKNDINLIGSLQTGKVKGLFSGDATTNLQKKVIAKYGGLEDVPTNLQELRRKKITEKNIGLPVLSNASFAFMPHHLSKTDGQAEEFAKTVRTKTGNLAYATKVDALGSTGRDESQYPNSFKSGGNFPLSSTERAMTLYNTKKLRSDGVFTTVLDKSTGATTTIEDFLNLSSSLSSENSAMEKEVESDSKDGNSFASNYYPRIQQNMALVSALTGSGSTSPDLLRPMSLNSPAAIQSSFSSLPEKTPIKVPQEYEVKNGLQGFGNDLVSSLLWGMSKAKNRSAMEKGDNSGSSLSVSQGNSVMALAIMGAGSASANFSSSPNSSSSSSNNLSDNNSKAMQKEEEVVVADNKYNVGNSLGMGRNTNLLLTLAMSDGAKIRALASISGKYYGSVKRAFRLFGRK
jgi:hypothetical protein